MLPGMSEPSLDPGRGPPPAPPTFQIAATGGGGGSAALAGDLRAALAAGWARVPAPVRDRWPLLLVPLALGLCLLWWHEPTVRLAPGMLVGEEPRQAPADPADPAAAPRVRGTLTIRPLARYELEARVLSKERYRRGPEARLSPYDLALGWRVMSDQAWLDAMSIDQGGRWFHVRPKADWIDEDSVLNNAANTHILPADDGVLATLHRVRRGDVVDLRGWLVAVVDEATGWRWQSSLSRTDRGGHSCEVMWLEAITITTARFAR